MFDTISIGAAATATVFISEVRLTSPVLIYLDLGTGSGLIAIVYYRILRAARYRFNLIISTSRSTYRKA